MATAQSARGRPRSAASEQAILTATLDLLEEGQGPATITINAIARRAGVGKDTIYRRWNCKEDLLLEALASQQRAIEVPADVTVRDGMIIALSELIGRMQRERDRRILRSLQSAGNEFPKLKQRYHDELVAPRRARLRTLVKAGIERGELSGDGDPYQAALMPFAAVIMSALEDTPISGNPRRAAERLVDALLDGITAAPRR
jgi:AcrR family transcriptional regulator